MSDDAGRVMAIAVNVGVTLSGIGSEAQGNLCVCAVCGRTCHRPHPRLGICDACTDPVYPHHRGSLVICDVVAFRNGPDVCGDVSAACDLDQMAVNLPDRQP